MRYIEDVPFTKNSGQPFKIEDPEAGMPEHEAKVGEVLKLCLDFYDGQHKIFVQLQQVLPPSEVQAFNRLMTALSEATDGYFHIETADFRVLQKMVGWVSPLAPWWRDGPAIDDLLNEALSTLPTLPDVGKGPDPEVAAANGASKAKAGKKA